MKRKIRNKRLSLGILYSLMSMTMGASLVEAQQTACETACTAVCNDLYSMGLQKQLNILAASSPVADLHVAKINDALGTALPDLTFLCGATPGGQTNCATVCAPSNVGQKAPQVKVPASKAVPIKK